MHDRSGIVLAFGWGTAYAMRLPPPLLAAALKADAKTVEKWTGGGHTDIARDLGADWLWGCWSDAEPDWIAASYRHIAPRN